MKIALWLRSTIAFSLVIGFAASASASQEPCPIRPKLRWFEHYNLQRQETQLRLRKSLSTLSCLKNQTCIVPLTSQEVELKSKELRVLMREKTACYISLTAAWRRELGVGVSELEGVSEPVAIAHRLKPPVLLRTAFQASSTTPPKTVMVGLASEISALVPRLKKIGLSGLAAYAQNTERTILNGLSVATRDSAAQALAATDHLHKMLNKAPDELEISPIIDSDPAPVDVIIATYVEQKRDRVSVAKRTKSEPVHLLRGFYEYTISEPGHIPIEGHKLNLVDDPVLRIFCKEVSGQKQWICSTK